MSIRPVAVQNAVAGCQLSAGGGGKSWRPEPAEVHDVQDEVAGLEDAVAADEPAHRHAGTYRLAARGGCSCHLKEARS